MGNPMVTALLRMELGCLAIVIFVAFTYFSSPKKMTFSHRLFAELIIVAVINIIFDCVTVYMVNNLETVNPLANFLCHKVFLGSLVAIVFLIFEYIVTLAFGDDAERTKRPVWERIPFYVGEAAILVLPIEYIETPRGNYSYGPYAYMAYVLFIGYFIASIVVAIRVWNKVERRKIQAIFIALFFVATCLIIQGIVPVALISCVGVTASVLAFFFTVESPDAQKVAILKDEKERANAANEAKTAFLANMSHEIRTPINAVLGFNEIIIRESKEPQIIEYARDIENAGKTLLGIINNVLDFSKIEAGKMELLDRTYELSALLNDVVNMMSFRARAKNLELKVSVDKNIPNALFGDDMRLRQIMLNIISNAIKYTESGSVTLNVSYQKMEQIDSDGYISADSFNTTVDYITLCVSVTDTGMGIKKDELERLCLPFERMDEDRNRTVEGTGLGLSIVKRLLDMMGSALKVESEYGKGSTFSFEVKQRVVDWTAMNSFVQTSEQSEKYHEAFTAPSARILIVDDVKLNLMVISALLKPLKMRIDTAMSGKEALSLVKENLYDVIFLDHRMPELDGVETLSIMHKEKGGLNDGTPVIALTANAVSGAKEFYLKNGFKDYLSKPVDMRHLEEALREYLPKSKMVFAQKEAKSTEQDSLPVDTAIGFENCGSQKLYREVISEFCVSASKSAERVQETLSASDWKNLTVAVHSIKSSARTIGASRLADVAANVEQYAIDADATSLHQSIPTLLDLLEKYRKKLSSEEFLSMRFC